MFKHNPTSHCLINNCLLNYVDSCYIQRMIISSPSLIQPPSSPPFPPPQKTISSPLPTAATKNYKNISLLQTATHLLNFPT